ncbi:Protein of unknown function [Georgenia satyanarayanai]|uniref:DinB superfamily protein n=1 Tax=Georgenia satyanarayanai TaxID=860221 RepID=A0A2Y9A3V4_9MICO|nr:DUF664 domain-containing protein [Georgenia satyanarayanai]PYG00932.1 uncharacterized protein DUF664 [Georgenia satyanarayanai]SSA39171.1 Protein of unknown function [Georgenia satyanarayanai]
MSAAVDLLLDAFSRVQEAVHRAGEGLTAEVLAERLDPEANSIGWLLWHLTRVQDDHVADVAGRDELWTAEGWEGRFDLPVTGIGYGHSAEEVGQVRDFGPELVLAYYDAVHARTLEFLGGLRDEDLDRVVDEAWDPPVTLGVRLVSVVDDCLEHAGQAAFVRGVLERTRP